MTEEEIKRYARLDYLAQMIAWKFKDHMWVNRQDPYEDVVMQIDSTTAKILGDLVREGIQS